MQSGRNLYSFLNQLKEQMAIIIVSHDFSSISGYVNKVFCLNRNMSVSYLDDLSQEQRGEEIRLLHHKENCPI